MLLPCRAILTLYKIIKRECIAMNKRLVAYFSASGVTAKVAENLADAIGADIFEIQPEVPYTKADLNWMDKKARSTIEMSNPASRPAIAAKRDNIDEYDTIFVGFPIWWYVAPTIINTFLENYNLKGKTIITVSTDMKFDIGVMFFDFMCCFKKLLYTLCLHHTGHINESNRFFFLGVWKWNKFF